MGEPPFNHKRMGQQDHFPKYDDETLKRELTDSFSCRAAFSKMVARYSEPLYWKIRKMVLTHDNANDVLQNTFLKAWNKLDSFRGDAKISTWLYRIAVNEALDFLRHQERVNEVSGEALTAVAMQLKADSYFDGDELQCRLQAAIALLPDVQRTVFCMRYYDDMKYSEISKALGTSEGALKASYHLAVKKIAAVIKQSEI